MADDLVRIRASHRLAVGLRSDVLSLDGPGLTESTAVPGSD